MLKRTGVYLLTLFLLISLVGCSSNVQEKAEKAEKVENEPISEALAPNSELQEAFNNPQNMVIVCGKEEAQVVRKYIKQNSSGESNVLKNTNQNTLDNSTIVIAYVPGMEKLGKGEKQLGYNLLEMEQGVKTNGQFIQQYRLGTRTTLVFSAKDLETLDKILKEFTDSLNKLATENNSPSQNNLSENGNRRIVYVPANPDKGFHWGYYLAIPSNKNKLENKDHKRFLMVDTNNTNSSNDYEEIQGKTKAELDGMRQYSMQVAEKLWSPLLYPVFPRPSVNYQFGRETDKFLTHSFDRDSAALHLKLKDPNLKNILIERFNQAGYDVNKFIRLDLQLSAMMDDAIQTLNLNGHNVQVGKSFLCGYSSSGAFTNRFTLLNPEKVKAVASGATLDDMVLPLSEYRGEKLIYPIGTSDYKDVSGKVFNLESHNRVARLIFMGEDDGGPHNTIADMSNYGDTERNLIVKLWGLDVLPRAKSLIELYGQSGGKGMFIIDKGIGHNYSPEMKDYILNFFKENRDNDEPAYPTPSNLNQLKYTMHN